VRQVQQLCEAVLERQKREQEEAKAAAAAAAAQEKAEADAATATVAAVAMAAAAAVEAEAGVKDGGEGPGQQAAPAQLLQEHTAVQEEEFTLDFDD
jgi:hypothetical protein